MTNQALLHRFLKYVKIDTESDPTSNSTPSTSKQWDLARLLFEELQQIGMTEVTIDDNAYVMATLDSNVNYNVPTIGFVSHFDTTPDFTGAHVNPQIIENYDGLPIPLKGVPNLFLSPEEFDDLLLYKGQTLVTTDGTTLLGADDKAGITEIMCAMEHLIKNPQIKHGKIRVCFTPDEEIGRGAHKFEVKQFGAEWAYTMDGSQIGELEYENFNAAECKVNFKGKIVHPGYAKGKMENALYYATAFINALPRTETPEETDGYEGFFHLTKCQGSVDSAELNYIIRDHDFEKFVNRKQQLQQVADDLNQKFGKTIVTLEINDQYYNMKSKIEPVMFIVDIAEEAMRQEGIEPLIKPIRGGTDGSQLSYMGLPCPNIFAGGHNFHGPYEYVPVESMQKAMAVICKIAELTAIRFNK